MFATRIEPGLLKQFKILAISMDRPMNSILEEAMKDFIKKHGGKYPIQHKLPI
ncbi:MAG: hypothetical protein NT072_13070 [Deltaproteobacteria bacterium]|nr:hypothetical protein [Deltaproteobacteria bacterium]